MSKQERKLSWHDSLINSAKDTCFCLLMKTFVWLAEAWFSRCFFYVTQTSCSTILTVLSFLVSQLGLILNSSTSLFSMFGMKRGSGALFLWSASFDDKGTLKPHRSFEWTEDKRTLKKMVFQISLTADLLQFLHQVRRLQYHWGSSRGSTTLGVRCTLGEG